LKLAFKLEKSFEKVNYVSSNTNNIMKSRHINILPNETIINKHFKEDIKEDVIITEENDRIRKLSKRAKIVFI